jgi:hypothetical protein
MERIGVDEIFRNNRNFQLIKKNAENESEILGKCSVFAFLDCDPIE